MVLASSVEMCTKAGEIVGSMEMPELDMSLGEETVQGKMQLIVSFNTEIQPKSGFQNFTADLLKQKTVSTLIKASGTITVRIQLGILPLTVHGLSMNTSVELNGMNGLGEASIDSANIATDKNNPYPILEVDVSISNPSQVSA